MTNSFERRVSRALATTNASWPDRNGSCGGMRILDAERGRVASLHAGPIRRAGRRRHRRDPEIEACGGAAPAFSRVSCPGRHPRTALVHCFWIVSACFSRCSLLFRADCFFSRDYMVLYCIFADFRPVNRLYFCRRKLLRVFRGFKQNPKRRELDPTAPRPSRPHPRRADHPAAASR